jgi:glucose/arabinose dehydrogenase
LGSLLAGDWRQRIILRFRVVGSGELWAVVNERDELGPNLVPDYLTSVREGGFYGWPISYGGENVDPPHGPPVEFVTGFHGEDGKTYGRPPSRSRSP